MKDLTLITLYNYLVHQSVPGELYNLDIVKRHYFHYKAFYFALNSISRDKIKKIEFNSVKFVNEKNFPSIPKNAIEKFSRCGNIKIRTDMEEKL